MKADADAAAAEEGDSDDSDEEGEAMDVAEVQEKLGACNEVELKKMLKQMKLPATGKVGAPAPSTPVPATGTALCTALCTAAPQRSHSTPSTAAAAHASWSATLTRCAAGAQKEELVARIIEQMQKDAALSEEEGDSDVEAMDLARVKEKLEACSEAELKQMLKEMKLPTKGKVGAPASPTHGYRPQQLTRSSALFPPRSHIRRWGPPSLTMRCRRAERGAGRAHHRADAEGGGGGGGR
jgi:hypothetical protein